LNPLPASTVILGVSQLPIGTFEILDENLERLTTISASSAVSRLDSPIARSRVFTCMCTWCAQTSSARALVIRAAHGSPKPVWSWSPSPTAAPVVSSAPTTGDCSGTATPSPSAYAEATPVKQPHRTPPGLTVPPPPRLRPSLSADRLDVARSSCTASGRAAWGRPRTPASARQPTPSHERERERSCERVRARSPTLRSVSPTKRAELLRLQAALRVRILSSGLRCANSALCDECVGLSAADR